MIDLGPAIWPGFICKSDRHIIDVSRRVLCHGCTPATPGVVLQTMDPYNEGYDVELHPISMTIDTIAAIACFVLNILCYLNHCGMTTFGLYGTCPFIVSSYMLTLSFLYICIVLSAMKLIYHTIPCAIAQDVG